MVRTLSIGGAIVYATAQYKTPDGHDIQGRGITPDVEVAMDEDPRYARDAERDAQLAAAVDALGGDGPQADAEQPPEPQGQQGQARQDEPDAQREAEQAAQQDAEQDEQQDVQQDVQQEVEQDEQVPPAEPEQQDEEGRP